MGPSPDPQVWPCVLYGHGCAASVVTLTIGTSMLQNTSWPREGCPRPLAGTSCHLQERRCARQIADASQGKAHCRRRHEHRQLGRALKEGGFDPARDITAITVNRWPHGYSPDTTCNSNRNFPSRRCRILSAARVSAGSPLRTRTPAARHTQIRRSIKVIVPSWSCCTPKRPDAIAMRCCAMPCTLAAHAHCVAPCRAALCAAPVKLTFFAAFLKGI